MRKSNRKFVPQVLASVAGLAAATAMVMQPAAAQSVEAARNAVRKALQTNPDLQSRMSAYLAKADAVDVAAAGWMPRVDLNANLGVDASKDKNAIGTTDVRRSGVSLQITQVLWDGLGTRNDVNRANHERLSRWFEFVEASEQTALEATRAVYDVQRQRKLVALADDNLAQHKQAAAKIESRVGAGVGRGVDLDQARARLALAESNLDTELANLHDVVARFQRIVGDTPLPDMGALELLRRGVPDSASGAVAQALATSPAIAAGIENLRAARATESGRKSALQPRVEAHARVGGGSNYSGVDGRRSDASVEVVMNWNLFDGGADRARVREQHNNVGQALDLRDKVCREVRQNTLVAFNEATKLNSQLGTLARNSAAIERAREAYRQQFDIGQRSLLDLLNAENEAYTARRALTNAVYDRAVAYVRTLASMNQLNVQLDITRDAMPKGDKAWKAGEDSASRCAAQAVDLTPLRVGLDAGAVAASVASLAQGEAAPVARAVPAPAVAPAPALAAAPAASWAAARTTAAPMPNVTPLVDVWAQAMRNKDLAGYAALYAPGFTGDEDSPAQWMAKHRYLFGRKAPMQVEVASVRSTTLADGGVETRFRQVQTAGSARTVQDKLLVWHAVNGQWRIAKESTL